MERQLFIQIIHFEISLISFLILHLGDCDITYHIVRENAAVHLWYKNKKEKVLVLLSS